MDPKTGLPSTIAGLIILVIALFPGLFGERVYRSVIGVDWREKDWRTVLRLLGFSVIGVVLYALFAASFSLLGPIHLIPSTYAHLDKNAEGLNLVFLVYCGHLVGGLFAGVLGAAGTLFLGKLSSDSLHPSAWEEFVRRNVGNHWVFVTLTNREVYAGRLYIADCGVAAAERDVVLEEPARYDETTNDYIALPYQHLFIRAVDLFSIATLHDPVRDRRTVPVGESLFLEVKDEGSSAGETTGPEPGALRQGDVPAPATDKPAVGATTTSSSAPSEIG